MSDDRYTAKARQALDESHQIARRRGHLTVEPEHLLLALLEGRGAEKRGQTQAPWKAA